MEIIRANISNNSEWQDFLNSDYNMFYDNRFLSYNDAFGKNIIWHHLIFKEKNKTLAIINGCEEITENGKTYISCDGVSFGGFIWHDRVRISDYVNILREFKVYLMSKDFSCCIIRNPPYLYLQNPNEEYEYALILVGFNVLKNSITNIIELNSFEFDKLTNPKKRAIQQSSQKIEINIINDNITNDTLFDFYNLLLKNRELKNVKPTHSLEELVYLKNNLSEKIILFEARIDSVLAGICTLFLVKNDVVLNFYLAADEEHKKDRVSDFILFKSIEWSKNNNFRLYDIGTSNVGDTLLYGLFEFKKKFMADGFLRKSYILKLN